MAGLGAQLVVAVEAVEKEATQVEAAEAALAVAGSEEEQEAAAESQLSE